MNHIHTHKHIYPPFYTFILYVHLSSQKEEQYKKGLTPFGGGGSVSARIKLLTFYKFKLPSPSLPSIFHFTSCLGQRLQQAIGMIGVGVQT